MRLAANVFAALLASPALADLPEMRTITEGHILPGYHALAEETADLSEAAARDCAPENPDLIAAYHDAFDAWTRVSHLRFGPSEQADRAFALAFWPDPRGATPKALAALIRQEDAAVSDAQAFAAVSIAARGLYALEFLLFDPQFAAVEGAEYRCRLTQRLTADMALTAAAIHAGWAGGYADLLAEAGNDTYRTPKEAARQIFTALSTGLEFTSQTRLGRPLGTYDRPRPARAEARRSGRSLRHVILSLEATRDLGALISGGNADLDRAFGAALTRARELEDPIFAGVATPQSRLRVEVLQQNIETIRTLLAQDVGPALGISAGFNSLDGD